MASRLNTGSLGEAGKGSNSLRGEVVATTRKVRTCVCFCVWLSTALQPLVRPVVISFPTLQGGKIVVIYMAQVQPNSNMSDICYYSEIFPPAAFEWQVTL